VEVIDDCQNARYPMPMTLMYKYATEVGCISYNLIYGNQGIDVFVSGDQLLCGAS
jgi:aspartate-semialdehyde dehydrogenase